MEYTVYKWSQSPFRPRSHKGIFYSLKFINLSKVTLLRATRVCNQEDLCMLMTSFSFNNFSSPGKRRWTTLWGLNTSLTKVISYYFIYPSFKIFLPFRLANVPRIIHHNQLSSGKFGRLCAMWKRASSVQQNCQIIEQLIEKTWGRGWVVFGKGFKRAEHFTRFTRKK